MSLKLSFEGGKIVVSDCPSSIKKLPLFLHLWLRHDSNSRSITYCFSDSDGSEEVIDKGVKFRVIPVSSLPECKDSNISLIN